MTLHVASCMSTCFVVYKKIYLVLPRLASDRSAPYSHHSSNPNVLSMIPESSYPSRGYDHAYMSHHQQSRHPMHPTPYRTLSHPSTHHWNATPEPLDPYYSNGLQERPLLSTLYFWNTATFFNLHHLLQIFSPSTKDRVIFAHMVVF
ncbi:hypothetical protein BJ165DRAFT_966407 [Panaeolus papilionaceus]|nr:hypothetical protein BJ165DRAFT_966407 [Panaeolus papilionaceus]